jgi:mannose-6-phosphate isomerase
MVDRLAQQNKHILKCFSGTRICVSKKLLEGEDMKSVVVYYSFTGNTRRVAKVLAESLNSKSEVDIIELKAKDEPASFFRQALRALMQTKAKVEAVDTDLAKYDLVCIGTPVWAFGPAPAINTFLSQCQGLKGKDAIVFTTYGSGAGNLHCIDYMKNLLNKKGVKTCKGLTLKGTKTKDKDYILSVLKSAAIKTNKRKIIVEKPWGRFEQFASRECVTVKILTIEPHQSISLQFHNNREELWKVLSGKAELTLGDSVVQAETGNEYYIEKKHRHCIKTGSTQVKVLEISFGDFDEQDIVRLEDVDTKHKQ